MNFEEFSSLEDLSNSACKRKRYQVSLAQKTELAEFIAKHLIMAEGKITLESTSGWKQVATILNAMSTQKPRNWDNWRKTWEGYVARAKVELVESKKALEYGGSKCDISPFSKKVLYLLACFKKYQVEHHQPTKLSATITQPSTKQELSSPAAVDSFDRTPPVLQQVCCKPSDTTDQLFGGIQLSSNQELSSPGAVDSLDHTPPVLQQVCCKPSDTTDQLFGGIQLSSNQELSSPGAVNCMNYTPPVFQQVCAKPSDRKDQLFGSMSASNYQSAPPQPQNISFASAHEQEFGMHCLSQGSDVTNYSSAPASNVANIVPSLYGKENQRISPPISALPEHSETLGSIITSTFVTLTENSKIKHHELHSTVSALKKEADDLTIELFSGISKLDESMTNLERRIDLLPKNLEGNVGPMIQSFLSSIHLVNVPHLHVKK